ncbi:hypothetical protein K438DRAFT_1867804 [Mycena galopus ATCC 62051]|nr:hypothetical protein K438DRAFT_1867804 [Mycena galopus ATCC 62051]
MGIPPAAIISLMTAKHQAGTPGIGDTVRNRLEWSWGLDHNHLDEHLQEFIDPQGFLVNDLLLVMPHSGIIREIQSRNWRHKVGVRRPNIHKLYKGRTSFEYLVAAADPTSAFPAQMLVSELPPHLVLATTARKIIETWGYFAGDDFTAACASFVERTRTAIPPDSSFVCEMGDFDTAISIHGTWSFGDYVPPRFLSEDSDHTMVEVEESQRSESESGSNSSTGTQWEVGSSASCYHEPKRRLLPAELLHDPQVVDIQLYSSVDGETDDDAISLDSHVSGAEDADESLWATIARGDYEVNRSRRKQILNWAADISGADNDEMLLNNTQIEEDPMDQPRFATSLDFDKPDYLARCQNRTTV